MRVAAMLLLGTLSAPANSQDTLSFCDALDGSYTNCIHVYFNNPKSSSGNFEHIVFSGDRRQWIGRGSWQRKGENWTLTYEPLDSAAVARPNRLVYPMKSGIRGFTGDLHTWKGPDFGRGKPTVFTASLPIDEREEALWESIQEDPRIVRLLEQAPKSRFSTRLVLYRRPDDRRPFYWFRIWQGPSVRLDIAVDPASKMIRKYDPARDLKSELANE